MSRFGIRPTEGRRRQAGSSLITTIALTGILALIVAAGLGLAKTTTSGSARDGREDISLQAAEAGVSQYVSRLVEDPRYFDRYVDTAEDPRIDSGGNVHPPGSAWTPGETWTYAAGPPTTFRDLQDERLGKVAYSLRITPPTPGSDVVVVQATGRTALGTQSPVDRTVQSQVSPSSIADFQIISNSSIAYGTTARTTGKLYADGDINHRGVAEEAAYAVNYVCSTTSSFLCPSSNPTPTVYQGGGFDRSTVPSFQDEFPNPIDFSQFTQSRLTLKGAATAGGTAYNDPSVKAWMLQFLSSGQVRIWKANSSGDIGSSIGSLTCPTTITVPANGAMHFQQSVIISDASGRVDACGGGGRRDSIVDGRVTVASEANIYVGGNIDYAGDDVLGLISANELIVARYAPRDLFFRAATLAQNGKWRTYLSSNDGAHDNLHFVGSQATENGGYASMYLNRQYDYDTNLQFLRPPFYPIIEGSWETRYFREITSPG